MTVERKAFLEHEANRELHTWGYLLAEALDEIDRLEAMIRSVMETYDDGAIGVSGDFAVINSDLRNSIIRH